MEYWSRRAKSGHKGTLEEAVGQSADVDSVFLEMPGRWRAGVGVNGCGCVIAVDELATVRDVGVK